MTTITNTCTVRLNIVESLKVIFKPPNKERLPGPRPNYKALTKLKLLEDKVGQYEWIEAWFEYLSEDIKDRHNIRDLILSKLPPKVLFRVGIVPSYKSIMLNYAKNPFLVPHLKPYKPNDYWLTSFCMKEHEKIVKDPNILVEQKKEVGIEDKNNKNVLAPSLKKSKKERVDLSVKIEPKLKPKPKIQNEKEKEAEAEIIKPLTDNCLDGVDLEDVLVQIDLFQGEQIIHLGPFIVPEQVEKNNKVRNEAYVKMGTITSKPNDIEFGSVTCSCNILSKKEMVRKIQAYDLRKKKWIKMPSLDFLPSKVHGMLAGEGGLLLLFGEKESHTNLNAHPSTKESKPRNENANEKKNKSHKKGNKLVENESTQLREVQQGETLETNIKNKIKSKIKSATLIPPYEPPNLPSQHVLVVCNPIIQTFRVLPPMHVSLENMVARLVVHPSGSSYVVYIAGFHCKNIKDGEADGMQIAIYKSITQKWEVFVSPCSRILRPSLRGGNGALALITKLCEGPTLFMSGELVTNTAGIYQPLILGYRLQTRTWKAYNWPSLMVVEHPQVLEVNNELYIIARGASTPTTINIWKFIQHVYDYPDCEYVTMMPQTLFNACFVPGIKTEWDCISSMDCISIVGREHANFIVSYNVQCNKWLDPIQRFPGFIPKLTVLGNWNYEIVPYALV